jgi:hypothetical protein
LCIETMPRPLHITLQITCPHLKATQGKPWVSFRLYNNRNKELLFLNLDSLVSFCAIQYIKYRLWSAKKLNAGCFLHDKNKNAKGPSLHYRHASIANRQEELEVNPQNFSVFHSTVLRNQTSSLCLLHGPG